MRNYTTNRTPISFTIDDDTFVALPTIPGEEMLGLIDKVKTLTDADQLAALYNFLDLVMLPESAELFASRMKSRTNPIDLRTAIQVVTDLTEEYTDRPTPASPPLPNGSGSDAAGSAGGASPTLAAIPPS